MKESGKLYTCSICNKKKQLNDFYQCKGRKTTSRCKCCSKELAKDYRDINKDRISKTHKEWVEKNLEKERKRLRDFHRDNPEKSHAWSAGWRKNNPDKHAAKEAKRRSKKLDRCPVWLTEQQLSHIKSIYKMARSISEKTGIPHHVDHIVPLQGENVSGLHVPWNLQVLPAKENLAKSNKFDDDMI